MQISHSAADRSTFVNLAAILRALQTAFPIA